MSNSSNNNFKQFVNESANNSTNYLKRLPIPLFQKGDYENAQFIIKKALEKGKLNVDTCDSFIDKIVKRPL